MSDALTIAQAAQRLGVCRRTIERRIKAGRIGALDVNPGGRRASWRIPLEEIERLLHVPAGDRAAALAASTGPPRPRRQAERAGGFAVRARRPA